MKECGRCKIEKNNCEFATKGRRVDGSVILEWQCKKCHSEYRKKHYEKNKEKYLKKARKWGRSRKEEVFKFLHDYFKTHPCLDCGESNPIVLEFDHVSGTKHKNVSALWTGSQKKLEAEIQKCEVVCANCHRKRTAKRSKWIWLRVNTDENGR